MLQLGRMSTVAKGRVLHADARCRLLFFIGHWRRIRWRRHPPLELIEWLCLILIMWEKPDPRVKLVWSINPLKEYTRLCPVICISSSTYSVHFPLNRTHVVRSSSCSRPPRLLHLSGIPHSHFGIGSAGGTEASSHLTVG